MTSHGLVHVLGLDVAETDLDGVIAVGCLSFNLRDSAGASLDDRDGNDVIVLVPNLGHANLAAENHADQDMIPTLAWSWDNAYTTERTPLEDHYLHDVLPSLVFRPDYLTTLLSRHFVQPEYSPGFTQLFSIHGCGRIHRDSYFTHIVYAGKVRGWLPSTAEGRRNILRSLLYSPAQDGEHIKCSPLRAELAMTLIYFSGPPPCSGDDTLMSA